MRWPVIECALLHAYHFVVILVSKYGVEAIGRTYGKYQGMLACSVSLI
jgi:hypothetical protein